MIDKIIEAARWAPSGENEQPWRLVFVRNPETRKKLFEFCKIGTGTRGTAEHCLHEDTRFDIYTDPEEREKNSQMYYTGTVSLRQSSAPLHAVVVGDIKGMMDTPYDLSACIENMILEAHSIGLGACWIHAPMVFPRIAKKVKDLFGIPQAWANTRSSP